MKTRQIFILVALLLAVSSSFAQNASEKLLVKYDSKTISDMQKSNPSGYQILDYFVNEACYVIDMPDKKIEFEELKRVNPLTGEISENQLITEDDLDNFNPLEYNVEYMTDQNRYYLAGSTGKLVVVPSYYTIKSAAENKERISKIK